MSATAPDTDIGTSVTDTWSWWQARRLRYNLTLGLGGCVAYGVAVAMNFAFGQPLWTDWRGALSLTVFLGVAYVVVMGAANVLYLLGPPLEAWVKPRDVERYRRTAFAMGNWGSLIAPMTFPVVQFATLIAKP